MSSVFQFWQHSIGQVVVYGDRFATLTNLSQVIDSLLSTQTNGWLQMTNFLTKDNCLSTAHAPSWDAQI